MLNNLRLTKPKILNEVLAAGALHDAKKTFTALYSLHNMLIEDIDNPYSVGKKIDAIGIRERLGKLNGPFTDLDDQFRKIEKLYQPTQPTNFNIVNIINLLNDQLEIVMSEFHQSYYKVNREYERNEIFVECDELQIGLAVLNLLKNACQAMEKRGKLELKVRLIENESTIEIKIIDSGKGINPSY